MDETVTLSPAIDILAPGEQTIPLVFASPHSGSAYPPEFLREAALGPDSLRLSEDVFVDRIFAPVVERGAPLLRALFPRALLDPNREPYELDPAMFEEELPDFVNTASPRVAHGLGTIPRIVCAGRSIYARKLSFAEAERRIQTFYHPYHRALAALVENTRARFGYCVLVDCHSMPSSTGPLGANAQSSRIDIAVGDCFGISCASALTAAVEAVFRALGYRVERNIPYAGGFTTRHYGQPGTGVHAVQIEINRRLYLNESTREPLPGMEELKAAVAPLIDAVIAVPEQELCAS